MIKKILLQARLFLKACKHPIVSSIAVREMFGEEVYENRQHIKMAADWLLKAQEQSLDGNGYSRGYYLTKAWDKGYIETTGYIIPTLFEAGRMLQDARYEASALKAFDWLSENILESGAFPDIDKGHPQAFDTGQVLLGLNFLIQHPNKEVSEKAKLLARKSAQWLSQSLDDEGSWAPVSFNFIPHSYYSRVAWALYETGVLLNEDFFKKKALLNIDWCLRQQLENGFFNHLRFRKNEPSFLHTMMYVLEGLLGVYKYTQDERLLQAVLRMAEPLRLESLKKDLLASQYDENFNRVNNERCMTGLAQWAGVSLDLFEITKNRSYLETARIHLYYLKSKQVKSVGSDIQGALPGSLPIWGQYSPFAYNNWPVKFFLDALMHIQKLNEELPVHEEQVAWVTHCFRIGSPKIATQLSPTSQFYIQEISQMIRPGQSVLDLGAGSGLIAEQLNKKVDCRLVLADPVMHLHNPKILPGDVYKLPADIGHFDVIYALEVFQHVSDLDKALQIMRSHLKPGGLLIVGDRRTQSLKFLFKPVLQLLGKWMYPWDSPFTEKWRSLKSFTHYFNKWDLQLQSVKYFTSPGSRLPWTNRYKLMVFKSCRKGLQI